MFPVLQHVDNHMSILQQNSLFRVFPRGVEPGIQRGKIYFNNTDMLKARALCGLLLFQSDCVLREGKRFWFQYTEVSWTPLFGALAANTALHSGHAIQYI